ncbi:hypothetical protein ABE893_03835 [Enterococcus entomosocium]|uniref:hypothetical protein n=1 Tax=Enterococcus entomosocium TaxID=3034352 RepID=UPI003D6B8BAB
MNETSFDELLTGNPLLEINTQALLLLVIFAWASASLIACKWRNEYQAAKIIRDYAYYAPLHLIVGWVFLNGAIVLVIGSYFMGLIVLLFRSNNYFYK